MTFMHLYRTATVEVPDLESLKAAWKQYGGPFCLVASFIVKKPLTESQFRRLPKALRNMVSYPDDSVAWLERLYRLEDTRS